MKTYKHNASLKITAGTTYSTKFGEIKVLRLNGNDATILKDSMVSHIRLDYLCTII